MKNSNYNKSPPNTTATALGKCADVVGVIAEYVEGGAYGATSRLHQKTYTSRKQKITKQLLLAVAYGMESKEANVPVKASDAGNLFKSHLYAKELLQKSPEYLLERGDITDWAGRTFKNITAFEYALWAKDFKMIEMMLGCIPETPEGDKIRAALFEQYTRVTAPTYAGGGLTYTHTYDHPNLDASGIPDGTTTTVTEEHTENHFDLNPICDAYQDYDTHFDNNVDGSVRTLFQRDDLWTKLIGKLQRFLPVHILQRYCDPNTPFSPLSQFDGKFKRSTDFYNYVTKSPSSLFGSSLSSNFALMAAWPWRGGHRAVGGQRPVALDLAAVRRLNEVSTNEIKNIIGQLSQPRHNAGPRP